MEMIYISSGILLCLFAFFVSLSNFFSRRKKKRQKNLSPEEGEMERR